MSRAVGSTAWAARITPQVPGAREQPVVTEGERDRERALARERTSEREKGREKLEGVERERE